MKDTRTGCTPTENDSNTIQKRKFWSFLHICLEPEKPFATHVQDGQEGRRKTCTEEISGTVKC